MSEGTFLAALSAKAGGNGAIRSEGEFCINCMHIHTHFDRAEVTFKSGGGRVKRAFSKRIYTVRRRRRK